MKKNGEKSNEKKDIELKVTMYIVLLILCPVLQLLVASELERNQFSSLLIMASYFISVVLISFLTCYLLIQLEKITTSFGYFISLLIKLFSSTSFLLFVIILTNYKIGEIDFQLYSDNSVYFMLSVLPFTFGTMIKDSAWLKYKTEKMK